MLNVVNSMRTVEVSPFWICFMRRLGRKFCSSVCVYMRCDQKQGNVIRMRIGLHSGSIYAGVVGTTKLRYDMWYVESVAVIIVESESFMLS
jgi:hypothetical protein